MKAETLQAVVYMRKACERKIRKELVERGVGEEAAQAIAVLLAMEAEAETRKYFSEIELDGQTNASTSENSH